MSIEGAGVWRFASNLLCKTDLSQEALLQRFINIRHPWGNHLSTHSAKKKKNSACNRYTNILPFDHNCVKVHVNEQQGRKRKYVNASVMKSSEGENPPWSYVAAQGPLRHTVADFWLMIVEKECRVIVMLTKILEGSENKCTPYFPQGIGDEIEESGVKVKCEEKHSSGADALERRVISIEVAGRSGSYRCIHYHMLCWPDHGAPLETGTVRSIMIDVKDVLSSWSGVPCVHCSAGVGRTGTYIAIDIIMKRLHALAISGADAESISSALDVDALIFYLRTQRMALVQSVEQYRFILVALRDFVQVELASSQN